MERIRLAFEGDPVAGISSILDATRCCYCPRYSWVIDPRLLIHTVVLLAKQGHVCFVATSLRTSLHARNPRRDCFFSHEPGSTSGAVGCIMLYLVSHLMVLPDLPIWLAASSHLKLLLSDLWRFDSLLPVSLYRMLMW